MDLKITVRNETEADVSAITEVTLAAFETLEISNHTEQFIIAALRAAKALTVSLVAEVDGHVIGPGHWRRLDTGRNITSESIGCWWLLPCGTSRVLQALRF